jgi:hypothetical protein
MTHVDATVVPAELRARLAVLLDSVQHVHSDGDARLTRLDALLRSMHTSSGEVAAVVLAVKTLRGRLASLQAAEGHLQVATHPPVWPVRTRLELIARGTGVRKSSLQLHLHSTETQQQLSVGGGV